MKLSFFIKTLVLARMASRLLKRWQLKSQLEKADSSEADSAGADAMDSAEVNPMEPAEADLMDPVDEIQGQVVPISVPFANADTNDNLEQSPTIRISFGDDNTIHTFTMDTGSVGVIASSDIFQPPVGTPSQGEGQQTYSSSGIIEKGNWYKSTITIYGENNEPLVTTNPVPILQVNQVACTDNARGCRARENPTGIAMFGMGFARQSATQVHGTSEYNPLLNIPFAENSGLHKGYLVTSKAIILGLDDSVTQGANTIQLNPNPEYTTTTYKEWLPVPMTISVKNGSFDYEAQGNILMDTGVNVAYLATPTAQPLVNCPNTDRPECVVGETQITVTISTEPNITSYTFSVGDPDDAMAPKEVVHVNNPNVFFNTSRHVLAGLDFYYDNTDGVVGYFTD